MSFPRPSVQVADNGEGTLIVATDRLAPDEPAPPPFAEALVQGRRGGTLRPRVRAAAWTLARGLLAGVVLGAAYRGWMRLIAPEPSFSWGGTIAIVVIVTVATLAASVCATARVRWRRPWARGAARVVCAALIVLALGTPPGAVTVPAFVLGGLALGRTDWPGRVRRSLAAAAVAATVGSLFLPVFELGALPPARAVAGIAGYAVLIGVSSWLFAIPTRAASGPGRASS